MIHIQVKAKSGLHAGAVWRLDNSLVSLGANSQSDVFLCDPEIPDTLITLRKSGRRFNIETLHSEARLPAHLGFRPRGKVPFVAELAVIVVVVRG